MSSDGHLEETCWAHCWGVRLACEHMDFRVTRAQVELLVLRVAPTWRLRLATPGVSVGIMVISDGSEHSHVNTPC